MEQGRFLRVLSTYKQELLMQSFLEFDEEEYVEYIKAETRAEMQAEINQVEAKLEQTEVELEQAKTESEQAKAESEQAKAEIEMLRARIKELEAQQ